MTFLNKPIKVGIDFDNTIANYHGVFYQAALEKRLIPESISPSKGSVRDYLRSIDQEEEWTKLQGYIYGARMDLATPYQGVNTFFIRCLESRIQTVIVSHKTKTPYLGPKYDLHSAAKKWLEKQPFTADNAFFELTLREKLSRISALNCDYFIDDLPELFAEEAFPSHVKKILFDPTDSHPNVPGEIRATSWNAISQLIHG